MLRRARGRLRSDVEMSIAIKSQGEFEGQLLIYCCMYRRDGKLGLSWYGGRWFQVERVFSCRTGDHENAISGFRRRGQLPRAVSLARVVAPEYHGRARAVSRPQRADLAALPEVAKSRLGRAT